MDTRLRGMTEKKACRLSYRITKLLKAYELEQEKILLVKNILLEYNNYIVHCSFSKKEKFAFTIKTKIGYCGII